MSACEHGQEPTRACLICGGMYEAGCMECIEMGTCPDCERGPQPLETVDDLAREES